MARSLTAEVPPGNALQGMTDFARGLREWREALIVELEGHVPDRPRAPTRDYVGFAVPLRLRSAEGELTLLTTLTRFGTATDVTVSELRLEAFLPADEATTARLAT
jgi:hypothetical protein